MPATLFNRSRILLTLCALALFGGAPGCSSTPTGATTSGNSENNGTILVAELGTGSVHAVVRFQQQTSGSMFSVTVSGGQPGQTISVSIGPNVVGSITLDAAGNGQLLFSSAPSGPDDQP